MDTVQAGCGIALSGWAGLKNVHQAHLHFEIQQMVPAQAETAVANQIPNLTCFIEDNSQNVQYKQGKAGAYPYCPPADPYGWTGGASSCPPGQPANWSGDFWQCITGIPARRLWLQ